MTLEESKIEIQDIIDIYEKEDMYPLLKDRQISALKVAISALQEQEAKTQLSAEGTTSDLISRQAAIDAAENAFVRGLLASPDIRRLPPAQPEPQWIPVSERLPDDLGDYLVSIKRIGWNMEEYVENDIAYWDDLEGFHKSDEVLAWMPLPEPYRAERSTDD